MRALFLPSHVGLGHVTRDEAIARYLRRIKPNLKIEWCSAEPALTHLRMWDETIISCSNSLSSFSNAIEGIFNQHGYDIRRLKNYLNLLRRNYMIIEESLDLEAYDLVFADEFWELMLSAPQKLREEVVFGSDLVQMPYGGGVKGRLLSLILNKYFKNSFLKFKHRIFMNSVYEAPRGRWYYIFGDYVRSWIKKNLFITGLCTSYLTEELPSVNEARKALGIRENEFLIVSSIGGTSAKGEFMLRKVYEAVKNIRENSKLNLKLAIISGPRAVLRFLKETPEWLILHKTLRSLTTYYMAGDVFIVRPGRTTVADLECLPKGTFSVVLIPIKNHMEHEHISEVASRRFPQLFEVVKENVEVKELAKIIENKVMRSQASLKRVPQDCEGYKRAAEYLNKLVS